MPLAGALPAISVGLQALGIGASIWGAKRQGDENMRIAKFQAEANERYLDKYNEYNTPLNQMKRFKEAGLNPHLVYGQGSAGNQSAPISYPDVKGADYTQIARSVQGLQDLVPLYNQTRMINSQVQATDAKTLQTTALAEVNRVQKRVLEANPLLNDEGFKATIDSMKAAASIKGSEAELKSSEANFLLRSFGDVSSQNFQWKKMQRQMDILDQRFRLSELDGKLKAEVLKSKEFANAILEVQKDWMTDAEITPQHIYQFIQMLLIKALPK